MDNLLDFIDASNDAGVYTFHVPVFSLGFTPGSSQEGKLRGLIAEHFQEQGLFEQKVSRLKRWVTDIEATHKVDAFGTWHVSLNLAKLFLLPGAEPKAELNELRALLVLMKEFFEAHPEARCGVQICNQRDSHRKTYASYECRIGDPVTQRTSLDLEHTERLHERVKASPALTAFMLNAARELQKVGPHAWFTLREEHLYGSGRGPYISRRKQGMLEKMFAEKLSVQSRYRSPEEQEVVKAAPASSLHVTTPIPNQG